MRHEKKKLRNSDSWVILGHAIFEESGVGAGSLVGLRPAFFGNSIKWQWNIHPNRDEIVAKKKTL